MTETDAVVTFIRISVVLLVAGLAVWMLRRRSPAARHATWLLALAACIQVTVLAPVMPSTELPVRLPSLRHSPASAAAVTSSHNADVQLQDLRPLSASLVNKGTLSLGKGANTGTDSPSSLLVFWIAGALIVLALRGAASWNASRLTRRAEICRDSEALSLLGECARSLGILRAPPLLISSDVTGPAVAGVIRPRIMLPAAFSEWSVSQLRAALLHELAHVQRRDPFSRLLASIACSLCWYHPGVWLAVRQLERESEAACDDMVLAAGEEETGYASQLLDLARFAVRRRLALHALMPMARKPYLYSRVQRILDPESVRTRPRARIRNVAAVGAIITAAGIAGIKPVAAHETIAASREIISPVFAKHIVGADTAYSQTISAEAGRDLVVDLKTAADVHVTGWDNEQVELRARLKGFEKVAMPRLTRSAFGIAFRLERMNGDDLRGHAYLFEIRVPRGFDVAVTGSGSGELVVSNIAGSVRGEKTAGAVKLRRVSADVFVKTGNGEIAIDAAPPGAEFKTSRGNITVERANGSIVAQSSKGNVNVGFAANAESIAESTIATENGDVVVGIPSGMSAVFQLQGEIGRTSSKISSEWPLTLDTLDVFDVEHNRMRQRIRGSMSMGRGGPAIHLRALAGGITLRRIGE